MEIIQQQIRMKIEKVPIVLSNKMKQSCYWYAETSNYISMRTNLTTRKINCEQSENPKNGIFFSFSKTSFVLTQ